MTNFFSQPAYEAITVNPPGPSAAKDEKKKLESKSKQIWIKLKSISVGQITQSTPSIV